MNEITLNYSPLKEESQEIKEGDLLKIDLGAHIDGFFGHAGTSIIAGGVKAEGEMANLIACGHTALQAAIRKTVAGNTNDEVTEAIGKVAESFGVVPLEGAYSNKHKKHVIDESEVIMNKHLPEKKADKYEFAKGDVFGLDVYVATGDGKCRLAEMRTTVFKRALENTYLLKTQSARNFLTEVNQRYPSLPFSMRSFEDLTQAKIGVKHCVDHELLEPFEVHEVRKGERVASFKATIAITAGGTLVLCGNDHFNADNF